MSKESKDVKVRKVISKWQQVFIWIIAIAFVAGIALWALAVNYTPTARKVKRSIEESVAYITVNGENLKNQTYWVFPEEVEQRYGDILSAYGNPQLDSYIEVPYVKTLITVDFLNTKSMLYYAEVNNIKVDKKKLEQAVKEEMDNLKKDTQKSLAMKTRYGSLSNYEKEFRKLKEQELITQAVKEKLAGLTEEELKKYYETNKENIINEHTSAEVDFATFESKEKMNEFIKLSTEKGITQAASELSITLSSYTLKKASIPEEIGNAIFDATSTLVSIPYEDTYYVFNIKSVQKVDTYEAFKNSAAYESVRSNLVNERFSKNFKEWKETKKVNFEFKDPVYKTWFTVLITESKDLLTSYKKVYEELFTETGELKQDLPIEQKTAFLVLADRISESTDTTLEKVKQDVKEFEKKIVKSVYEATKGSSKEILRRMKEYEPNRKDIAYSYYSKLYDEIKPYLQSGLSYYVMNDLFVVYQGLAELADNKDVDIKIRADSLYKMYEINKDLGELDSAKAYLSKLKELMPDYKIDFKRAEQELENLRANAQTDTQTNAQDKTEQTEQTKEKTGKSSDKTE